jgi:beta-lactamase class A
MFPRISIRFWLLFSVTISLIALLSFNKAQTLPLNSVYSNIPKSFLEQQKPEINSSRPLASEMTRNVQRIAAPSRTASLRGKRSEAHWAWLTTVDISAAQGNVGIGVLDLNTGESWFHNGTQQFPMQSVFKLPVGIVVLKLVDEGKVSLGQLVTISRQEFAPGWSPILKEIPGNSGQFTVRDLLERSVGSSDNTAADALVRLVGGTEKVTDILHQMNIQGIRVDRLEQQLQPDCVGMTNFRPELVDEQKYAQAVEKIPDAVKRAALERYLTDPRDTATPEATVNLLAKLQARQLLSENSTALLIKIMTDSPTGQQRLKAGLPKDWSIAHKTGSGPEVLGVGTATNDVGIISSPTGKQVAISVFISGSKAPMEMREKVMAEIASTVVKESNDE